MKKFVLPFFILMFGYIYIFIIPTEPVSYKILMKVIPMMLIIILAFGIKNPFSPTYKKYIVIGLFISMIADAVIYWFLAGLGTFFVAHIFYILAFRGAKRQKVSIWVGIILFLYTAAMAFLLVGSQLQNGQIILSIAIFSYILILFIMGWKALGTKIPYAIVGAILFILSDSVLAIDRFIEPVPYRDALVMVSYYSAQFLIAKSIGSRVVKYSVNPKSLIR